MNTTTLPPSGQITHHLVTINILTSLPYTATILTDPDYLRTLAVTRRTLHRLSMQATGTGEVITLLPLGPVLDGAYAGTGRQPWFRLKTELLTSSWHNTPEAVKSYLNRLLGTDLLWDDLNGRSAHSRLRVASHTLHARRIESLDGDAARDAMNRVAVAENALYALASSGSSLARTLPAKREVGLADMILMPMAQGGRR